MTSGTGEDWQKVLAGTVGRRVRHFREVAGMSAQKVADVCTHDLGFKLLRTTLANLEAGTRKNVTIGEVIAIAKALQVPPLSLLFPLEESTEVAYLPNSKTAPWEAWKAFAAGMDLGYGPDLHALPPQARQTHELASMYAALEANERVWGRLRAMAADRKMSSGVREQAKRDAYDTIVECAHSYFDLKRDNLPLPPLDADFMSELVRVSDEIDRDVVEMERHIIPE
ncbi:helix-turn-helix domain-containing protein [Zhihengliuella halotolerans]|uniref:helix-turn-helix domain-containing protein n=1 Tax=Zhihengliuella halotolerans TaxID=370736 RepID=UPI000C80D6B1|nr:helix-turn-helix transcriptional regulator [Zhihengliuella halotolerans]